MSPRGGFLIARTRHWAGLGDWHSKTLEVTKAGLGPPMEAGGLITEKQVQCGHGTASAIPGYRMHRHYCQLYFHRSLRAWTFLDTGCQGDWKVMGDVEEKSWAGSDPFSFLSWGMKGQVLCVTLERISQQWKGILKGWVLPQHSLWMKNCVIIRWLMKVLFSLYWFNKRIIEFTARL